MPNEGLVGRMNMMQRRLIRRGLKDEITTKYGLVLVTHSPGISVEALAVNISESEFWLTREHYVQDIKVARNKEEIWAMLNSVEPKMAILDIEKVSNLNRWMVLITRVQANQRQDHNQCNPWSGNAEHSSERNWASWK